MIKMGLAEPRAKMLNQRAMGPWIHGHADWVKCLLFILDFKVTKLGP